MCPGRVSFCDYQNCSLSSIGFPRLFFFLCDFGLWPPVLAANIFCLCLSWEHAAQIPSGSSVGHSVKEVPSPDRA
jgi:hypothetical protein